MLHIILLILKILGFLILVLAGLMLVAVITVLFAPAGYRFDLTAEEFGKSILGKLRFYWIKPFISGEICYDNGNLTWNIRAAWKKSVSYTHLDVYKRQTIYCQFRSFKSKYFKLTLI